MQVLKFGGTSIGSADAIKRVVDIISSQDQQCIAVFSAFSGVTNLLNDISSFFLLGHYDKSKLAAEAILTRHQNIINDLFISDTYKDQATQILNRHMNVVAQQVNENSSNFKPKEILAQGELISSQIILIYFKEIGLDVSSINALDFMRLDENQEPDQKKIKKLLHEVVADCPSQYILTQGYICRNVAGEINNLKRGGSDYSAALIGVAIDADTIQIWTDIDGLHNNDPRFVDGTKPITSLSFEEAAELAYFGAKVLHPQSILPAKEANIPVLLKNTFQPGKPGTLIQKQCFENGVRAIAGKDGITTIKIKSYRMLMSYGFLQNIFEIFERYKTSIDVITTSEVGVSLTIDNTRYIEKIINELSTFGEVTVENEKSIVSIVGYFPADQVGVGAQILDAIKNIPICMISFGGSQHNFSLIINTKDKINALNQLHNYIFTCEDKLELA
jgi:aspartate kinase